MRNTELIIHGEGRSGTSWLQKIFDMHPETFAIFEPEAFYEHPAPWGATAPQKKILLEYLDNLKNDASLRSMRKRPFIKKAYRAKLLHYWRISIMYSFTAIQRLAPRKLKFVGNFRVSDFCDRSKTFRVIKSVSHHSAIEHLAKASPKTKFIYILRHPCGKVFSTLRGIDQGKMPLHHPLQLREIENAGCDVKLAKKLKRRREDQVAILAFRWAAINSAVIKSTRSLPNVRILKYEDLCEDPIKQSKSLFQWVELDWHADVETFLESSIKKRRDGKQYHSIVRNPMIAANKWKSEMDSADRELVIEICRPSKAFEVYN